MNLSRKFIVKPGVKVRLCEWDPDDTEGIAGQKKADNVLADNVRRLAELQYLLYAENKRSVLIVLQAMDAGGKDGTIRHVLGPLNPQGCKVISFKTPTQEELEHDFLWRIHKAAPRNGEIRVFNRSQYEDVLIVRIHGLVPKSVWSERYDQINAFEKLLTSNGTNVLKFFLHIGKDEQLKRFEKRLENPRKHWKANPEDFQERRHWKDYIKAYEDVLSRCSTSFAPWYVIPANKKWFRNSLVSQILVEQLSRLKMEFPKPAFDVSKMKLR